MTIPVEPTVANDVLLLAHEPPDTASDSATVLPGQTVVAIGLMATGVTFTVTDLETVHPDTDV